MSAEDNRVSKALAVRPAPSGYDVGYGKPPVATRFVRSKSGNPKGRPKAVRQAEAAGA